MKVKEPPASPKHLTYDPSAEDCAASATNATESMPIQSASNLATLSYTPEDTPTLISIFLFGIPLEDPTSVPGY